MPTMTRANLDLTLSAVDTGSRTITGTVTYFDQVASASTGRVVFQRGSLSFPDDLRRVKLFIEHDRTQTVGYATGADVTDEKIDMSFYVPEGPEGDVALEKAANGTRDGLSVGAFIDENGGTWNSHTQTMHVTAATVREVSLCSLPAFDNARVSDVAASAHQLEGTPTMDENTTPIPAPADVPAQAPPVITSTHAAPKTLAEAAEMAVALADAGLSAPQIAAKLQNVTPAEDKGHGFIGEPEWLGELWTARRSERPLIDCLTKRPLGRRTSVKGWRWKTRPTVDDYEGNLTEVPSSKVETEPIESKVKRIAAGWPIDRIYADMGEPSMIEALWEGAVEDYTVKTEAAVMARLVAEATDAGDPADLPATLVKLGVLAAKRGARIDFVAFGTQQWETFTALKKNDVPWWMGGSDGANLSNLSASVNGLRLFCDPTLTETTVIAGDRRAATYYENSTPIRVNGVNVFNGGIDLGLFGYYGLLVNDPDSLFKVEA